MLKKIQSVIALMLMRWSNSEIMWYSHFSFIVITSQTVIKIYKIQVLAFQNTTLQKAQSVGLSIYTLTHLNIDQSLKLQIFKLFLELPIFLLKKARKHAFTPWNIFFHMTYNQIDKSTDIDLTLLDGVLGNLTLATHRFSSNAEKLMSDVYLQALNREFILHHSELGPENRFSFVEHNSGIGLLSAKIANEYKNASIVSLERNERFVEQHASMLADLNIQNNVICLKKDSDSYIFQRIYESPELFRFQILSDGFLDGFIENGDLNSWGRDLGNLLSTALTTFLVLPSALQISFGMLIFMEHAQNEVVTGCYRSHTDVFKNMPSLLSFNLNLDDKFSFLSELSDLTFHPVTAYRGFETRWLLSYLHVEGGSTEVLLTPIYPDSSTFIPIMIRCDIINMTRHVHHHYDYAKDGHSRTYTMHVEVNSTESSLVSSFFQADISGVLTTRGNETIILSHTPPLLPTLNYYLPLGMHPNQHQIVSVRLYRDKDSFFIPYTSIYGITLISLLRLGLEERQRERLFSSFLRLPLYEDMAPWNIVLMGKV